MRNSIALLIAALLLGTASASLAAEDPKTEEEKVAYAIGLAISQNLEAFSLSAAELEQVKAGIADATSKSKPKVELETYGPKIQELQQARAKVAAEAEKQASAAFLDKAAAAPGVEKKPSGLLYKELKAGAGEHPKATDTVKVHYHGTLVDGTVFDSSVQRGEPAQFPLNHVIPCWTEGVQLMKVGGKSQLTCPGNLAYGDRSPSPKIKPGAALIFEVELLEISQAAAAAPAAADAEK
ncbi:MAG: FKBP-type peptidyl-prolyl cis-trans isomerase [Deltaproteobacteria bacterium]|nr:FKBP-type peptidyl-prolyl cis-trans isomerase [Deltaproteobacteria bacterium]